MGQKLQEENITPEELKNLGELLTSKAWELKDSFGDPRASLPEGYELVEFDEQLFLALSDFHGDKREFPLSYDSTWIGSFYSRPEWVRAPFQALLKALASTFQFPAQGSCEVWITMEAWGQSGVQAKVKVKPQRAVLGDAELLQKLLQALQPVFEVTQQSNSTFAMGPMQDHSLHFDFLFPFYTP